MTRIDPYLRDADGNSEWGIDPEEPVAVELAPVHELAPARREPPKFCEGLPPDPEPLTDPPVHDHEDGALVEERELSAGEDEERVVPPAP
jgi:hypothetical protein